MPRILALADEVEPTLSFPSRLEELAPDVILSCGDLPFDYLEFVLTVTGVPLVFVPGNHDPDLRPPAPDPLHMLGSFREQFRDPPGPSGGLNADERVVDAGPVRVAGLGGSMRYREGPHLYTERAMRGRARRLLRRAAWRRLRDGRRVEVLLTHAPPRGLGDEDDLPHRGFQVFHHLVRRLRPRLMIHGHVHPHGLARPDRRIGGTLVVNAVPHRILEV
jgi:hypothetical protein